METNKNNYGIISTEYFNFQKLNLILLLFSMLHANSNSRFSYIRRRISTIPEMVFRLEKFKNNIHCKPNYMAIVKMFLILSLIPYFVRHISKNYTNNTLADTKILCFFKL